MTEPKRRGRPPKLEGAATDSPPVVVTGSFAQAVEAFKTAYPDEWEAIRLGPCQYGIAQMIEKLS